MQLFRYVIRNAFWIAVRGALPGQAFQRLLRGQAGDMDLVRVLVAQFVQRETATIGDLHGAFDGAGMAGEQAGHFLGRFEVTVGGVVAIVADLIDGAALADAGQHVGEHVPAGRVIQHIAGGDGGNAGGAGEVRFVVQANGVVGTALSGQREISAIGEIGFQALENGRCGRRADDGDHALRRIGQIVPGQVAAAFSGAAFAFGEQAAEAGVSGLVRGVDETDGPSVRSRRVPMMARTFVSSAR